MSGYSFLSSMLEEALQERDEARRELQVLMDSMAVRRMNNGALVYDLKEHILCLERKLKEAKQMFDQLKLERMREEVTAQQDPEAQVCVYCGDALKKIKQEESK